MEYCLAERMVQMLAACLVWRLAEQMALMMALEMAQCQGVEMGHLLVEMTPKAEKRAHHLVHYLAEQMEHRIWQVAPVHLWALHLVLVLVGTL